ncbi:MAG: lipoyl(octanoyl) transferase LipB [Pseudomonadota bacterium]
MPTNFVYLGQRDYEPVWRAMQSFTDTRDENTQDEVWLVEHPPVFTVGMNGGMEHVIAPGDIPVVHIDRGGQVTFHGLGQMVIYPLINLRSKSMGVRDLVTALENVVIDTLKSYGMTSQARRDAPGVYVSGKKIASLGLRIRKGCSYHGLAFNIDMDLRPFDLINPCGFSNLTVIDLKSLGVKKNAGEVIDDLQDPLVEHLRLEQTPNVQDKSDNSWSFA